MAGGTCRGADHTFGVPAPVGGGLLRAVCGPCGRVRLDVEDVRLGPNGLFASAQRHEIFSPLVEYAALYGHELIEEARTFGTRRGSPAPVTA